MTATAHPLRQKYARSHIKRTTTCPGCGIGTVSQAILRAIDELQMDIDDFIFVSGIGCSAWIPSPFYNADTLHTTHGRPIAFATGVKLGLPHKHVMVVSGDGDLTAIGGNHLIHAARRNINLTVVLGKQRYLWHDRGPNGSHHPPGNQNRHQSLWCHGARFRYFSNDRCRRGFLCRPLDDHSSPPDDPKSIKKGIQKKGFALLEAVSQCPVQYGRASQLGGAVDMLKHFKENSIRINKAQKMDETALQGKIIVGEFIDREKDELSEQWLQLHCEMMEDR